jgi:hypothetical protein
MCAKPNVADRTLENKITVENYESNYFPVEKRRQNNLILPRYWR